MLAKCFTAGFLFAYGRLAILVNEWWLPRKGVVPAFAGHPPDIKRRNLQCSAESIDLEQKLPDGEAKKRLRAGGNYPTDGDIHPLRLCEEIKNFMQREAILSVDGQEILNFGPPVDPDLRPQPPLNSGPFGTMGVGLPFAVGAKAAKPPPQPSPAWAAGKGGGRSSACTATAPSAGTRSNSTLRSGPNCGCCA